MHSAMFTYVNNADRQLLELALQMIGMKLTGRLENASDVALHIINDNDRAGSSNGYLPSLHLPPPLPPPPSTSPSTSLILPPPLPPPLSSSLHLSFHLSLHFPLPPLRLLL